MNRRQSAISLSKTQNEFSMVNYLASSLVQTYLKKAIKIIMPRTVAILAIIRLL
jgi:hypothetical protein